MVRPKRGLFVVVEYYYPTLEIVGVSNEFIRPWAILISHMMISPTQIYSLDFDKFSMNFSPNILVTSYLGLQITFQITPSSPSCPTVNYSKYQLP